MGITPSIGEGANFFRAEQMRSGSDHQPKWMRQISQIVSLKP